MRSLVENKEEYVCVSGEADTYQPTEDTTTEECVLDTLVFGQLAGFVCKFLPPKLYAKAAVCVQRPQWLAMYERKAQNTIPHYWDTCNDIKPVNKNTRGRFLILGGTKYMNAQKKMAFNKLVGYQQMKNTDRALVREAHRDLKPLVDKPNSNPPSFRSFQRKERLRITMNS